MRRRILIIVNPAAGRKRRSETRLNRVVDALRRRGCEVVLHMTQGPGDAERLARTADPVFDVIVAAGGDGTVNEVANGLRRGSQLLAVLPLGTGNVLANEIEMPHAPEALARVIAEAPARPIWPGLAGDRLFLAVAGIGFDADVLSALGAGLKRRIGKLAFVWAVVLCLLRYRRRQFVVGAVGAEHRAASVVVVKGRRYAGNFVIAPAASLAEPMLHVVLFRRPGRLAAVRALAALALGGLHRLPEVSIFAAPSVAIAATATESDATFPVEIDGEITARMPIAFGIAETPLLLVQPMA
ncbi:MAG: diacylglycerol kinase family protein [Stellaceae bacterium]